jgi:hypothetical protein
MTATRIGILRRSGVRFGVDIIDMLQVPRSGSRATLAATARRSAFFRTATAIPVIDMTFDTNDRKDHDFC